MQPCKPIHRGVHNANPGIVLGERLETIGGGGKGGGISEIHARHAKEQHERYAELLTSNGAIEDKRAVWARLDELAAQAKKQFPLDEAQSAELRADLQLRLKAIIAAEESALSEMAKLAN